MVQVVSTETAYRSSQTLITPSSPGIMIAAFTSSLHPSNFDKRTGFFVELNLSPLDAVAGLISAAMFLSLVHLFRSRNRNIPSLDPQLPTVPTKRNKYTGPNDWIHTSQA
jgi:hypothetical protein